MFLNVVFDLLFGHCADRRAEVASTPQMLPPIPLLEMGEFILQFARRGSFHILSDFRRTECGWTRYEQMDMVGADVPFQDGDFTAHAHLPNDLAHTLGYLTLEHFVAILGRPYKVVLNIVGRMRPFSILWYSSLFRWNYTSTCLSCSPQGEGFRPGAWN